MICVVILILNFEFWICLGGRIMVLVISRCFNSIKVYSCSNNVGSLHISIILVYRIVGYYYKKKALCLCDPVKKSLLIQRGYSDAKSTFLNVMDIRCTLKQRCVLTGEDYFYNLLFSALLSPKTILIVKVKV